MAANLIQLQAGSKTFGMKKLYGGKRLAPPLTTPCGRGPHVPVGDIGLRDGAGHHRLLQKPTEHQPTTSRGAAVEPKGKFLQIALKMHVTYWALMGSKHPTLEQTCDAVDSGHRDVCWIPTVWPHRLLTCVPLFGQRVIAAPPIGADHRAGGDDIADERNQARAWRIGDMAHAYPSAPFGVRDLQGNDYNALVGTAPTFPSMVHASKQRLINFHRAWQGEAVGPDHRDPGAVQHGPCPPITRPQSPLERRGRQARFRRRQMPRRLKPRGERGARLVEDGRSRHRRVVAAGGAHQPATRLPPGGGDHPTRRTAKRGRPPQSLDVRRARGISREHPHERAIRPRVVTPRHKGRLGAGLIRWHLHHNILTEEELAVYPPMIF